MPAHILKDRKMKGIRENLKFGPQKYNYLLWSAYANMIWIPDMSVIKIVPLFCSNLFLGRKDDDIISDSKQDGATRLNRITWWRHRRWWRNQTSWQKWCRLKKKKKFSSTKSLPKKLTDKHFIDTKSSYMRRGVTDNYVKVST